jgi:hypothetical protein
MMVVSIAMAIGGLFFAGLYIFTIVRESLSDPSFLSLNTLAIKLIFLSCPTITIWLAILFVHLFPDIGISPDRFWYRPLFYWYSVPWSDVSQIHEGHTTLISVGLLVYTEQLPFFYRSFPGMYGGPRWKAIIASNHLRHFKQLKEELHRYKLFKA